MQIGDKIKQVRNAKGLTQKMLGERCGVSDTVIRHYEKGLRAPKMSTINKISIGLGVSSVELIDNTPYIDYFNKDYPKIVRESRELIGFIDYLQALGYKINEVKERNRVVIELVKDNHTLILIGDDFEELQSKIKDTIQMLTNVKG